MVAEFDEDEFLALVEAIREQQHITSWTNLHEVMAAAVEALWAVLGRLDAGIPVVNTRSTKKPHDYGRYPRPEWVQSTSKSDDGVLVVSSPGAALRIMKGQKQ